MGKLQSVGESRKYDTSGKFLKICENALKNLYVYHFNITETASSLNGRNPRVTERVEPTDTVLPRTTRSLVELDYVLSTRPEVDGQHTEKIKEDTKYYMNIVGEVGRNALYLDKMATIFEQKDFVVTGNKSVSPVGPALKVSKCSTSRPDLVAYNPRRSAMVVLFNVSEDVKERVKALKAVAWENKMDDKDTCQQLLGAVEKELGDMSVAFLRQNPADPIFKCADVIALSLNHGNDSCTVRRVMVNMVEGSSNCTRGRDNLTVENASNRVLALFG